MIGPKARSRSSASMHRDIEDFSGGVKLITADIGLAVYKAAG